MLIKDFLIGIKIHLRNFFNNFIIEKQSDEEIENDILEIQKMLYPKKIIIVSHYNVEKDGQYLNSRII